MFDKDLKVDQFDCMVYWATMRSKGEINHQQYKDGVRLSFMIPEYIKRPA